MGEPSEQLTNLLIEEYKLHRGEVLQQKEAQRKQTAFIQVYGSVLFGVGAAVFPSNPTINVNAIPQEAKIAVLLFLSVFLLYFISLTISASYNIFIIQKRMSEIEIVINKQIGTTDFCFESKIGPQFFGSFVIPGNLVSPDIWVSIFRVSIVILFIFILMKMAEQLVERSIALVYITTVSFVTAILIVEYCRIIILYRSDKNNTNHIFRNRSIIAQENGATDAPIKVIVDYAQYYLYWSILIFSVSGISAGGIDIIVDVVYSFVSEVKSLNLINFLLGVILFTFMCAVMLPIPSELPLIFVHNFGIIGILIAAATGKMLGTILLAIVVRAIIKKRSVFPKLYHFINKFSRKYNSITAWAYFFCQSVPFFPMRTSTIVFSGFSVGVSGFWIRLSFLSFLGTIVRMLLMWALIELGFAILPVVGAQ